MSIPPKSEQRTLPDMSGAVQELQGDKFIGQIFGGKYRIISEISKGGMGRIFQG